jgi:hypothetical protein
MQSQDQDTESPVIDQPGQRASEIQTGALAAVGRRRTQEQGQGDLDDDWQDTTPAAVPEQVPSSGQSDPDR